LEKTAILLALWGLPAKEFHEIESRFELEGILNIVPLPLEVENSETPDEEHQKREFAQKTFFNAIDSLRAATTFARTGKSLDLIRTKRVVHTLVDQIVADESYLLELTALKSYDEYTFVHSTNVCIYSICLGNRLDLTKTELAALGFAALFHDIGKMQLPAEILNKPSDFNEQEWELMRKHPVYGVLAIARTMPFDEKSCRAMLVAFEHHYNLDGSGYPEVRVRRALNLASKIVAICDVFDALTSGRSYRRDPLSPERVIEQMSLQAGMKFDQNLLKLFIHVVSVFPPGTLLLLDDNHLALVSGRNDDNLLMPKAILIGQPEKLFEQGERINLADRDPQTGKYLRNVVRTVNPQELNLNLSRYILEAV
jgi:HD-GYP domain-containing protein (c-di-GMP phosphodiesterase class II)